MEDFDFHSLPRKELQALCKLNKIPANLTNVAMADHLRALHQVEGLDELVQALKSDPQRSPGKTVPGTPVVPLSGRRSTVRTKPAVVEPLTRTRRSTRKIAAPEAGAVSDTPLTVASRRKVPVPKTSKFSLDAECQGAGGVETIAKSIQKGSLSLATPSHKDEISVQKVYSSRRSERFLEKSMAKMCLKEDVEKHEGVAGDDDSLIAQKEETHGSCQNLDPLLENETEIQDGVSADHAKYGLKQINNGSEAPSWGSREENVDKNSDAVEPLPKADYYTGNEGDSNVNKKGTVSLEDVEKSVFRLLENETEMNCDPQEDECNEDKVDSSQQKQCIDLVECDNILDHEADHLQDIKTSEEAVGLNNESLKESESGDSLVEHNKSDASSIGNHSLDTEIEINHEVKLNCEQIGSDAEEQPIAEPVIDSYQCEEILLGSPNLTEWSVGRSGEWLDQAGAAVVSTPIIPALKSIVVMGSNSHHVSTPAALQVSEDASPAVTETKPTTTYSDDETEDYDGMKMDGIGDVEGDAVQVATSTKTISSPFAAEALQSQFPRPTTTVKSSSSSANKQQPSVQKTMADIASSGINKENIGHWEIKMEEETEKGIKVKMTKKKAAAAAAAAAEEWDELSIRQLSKMLKEKLQLANNNNNSKAEKAAENRQALQTLSDNIVPVAEPDRKN